MDTSFTHLMFLYTARMFGFSMVMMPVMTNGLNQLPMKMNPHGTAMNNTLQQVSGAIGTALLVTVMNARAESRAKDLGAEAMAKLSADGVQPSMEAAAEIEHQIFTTSMLDGITHAFFVSTIIAVLALVLAIFMKRVELPEHKKVENVALNQNKAATE